MGQVQEHKKSQIRSQKVKGTDDDVRRSGCGERHGRMQVCRRGARLAVFRFFVRSGSLLAALNNVFIVHTFPACLRRQLFSPRQVDLKRQNGTMVFSRCNDPLLSLPFLDKHSRDICTDGQPFDRCLLDLVKNKVPLEDSSIRRILISYWLTLDLIERNLIE